MTDRKNRLRRARLAESGCKYCDEDDPDNLRKVLGNPEKLSDSEQPIVACYDCVLP